ncbi:MAG: hypothetical protein NUV50_00365 [Rhodospirillales bacterium]|nr:hypothetical protein [Rhodospirillales bacterium]
MKNDTLSAAVAAIMGKAKLHGLDVQKQEVTVTGELRLKTMSDEQLEARLDGLLKALGRK